MQLIKYTFWIMCAVFCCCQAQASSLPTLRVGVLQYGTLNWEMEIIHQQNQDKAYGFNLETLALGSPQALLVALQGGAVDLIIGDWLWAARQQENGQAYYFYPYSTAAGMLISGHPNTLTNIQQLKGKKVGFAGGKANKNWLLYSAYIQAQTGIDLAQQAEIKFASPPMLNTLLKRGDLDAIVTFWHYGAELNAANYPTLLTMKQVLQGFDIKQEIPLIGWLFKQQWANQNSQLIENFLALSYATKRQMQHDDDLWQKITSFTAKYPKHEQETIIDAYRAGIPHQFNASTRRALQHVFRVLKTQQQDNEITGNLTKLPDDLFWSSNVLP
jgi:NitT/TauT family transport system substrate-binding protein